jgi:hypothetical protein
MKLNQLICVLFLTMSFMSIFMEAAAVRPPLKPLNIEQFRKMIADADVIAIGTINRVRLSKTLEPPLETVAIHVTMTPERIMKGDRVLESIAIEESYQRFPVDNIQDASDSRHATEKTVTAQIAGPAPPVGMYRDGDRVLVFLKSMAGLNQYRPLGSGNHDAYLGVFWITSEGVKPVRYRFDDVLTEHAKSETDFLDFITSTKGKLR